MFVKSLVSAKREECIGVLRCLLLFLLVIWPGIQIFRNECRAVVVR